MMLAQAATEVSDNTKMLIGAAFVVLLLGGAYLAGRS